MPTAIEHLTAALAGEYEIVRELGAGGMATVYLARDVRHDRDVAIKVLHPDLGAVLGAERFLAEIKTTAKLQHPHILPLLDSGDAAGLLYYVMPVVTGESLRARIQREGTMRITDAVRIASEIAAALDYAHRHGVVHRDIKPDNVLLHDGSALVADFGISLAVQTAGAQRMTQTGLSLGTPQYMSPEQAMGERSLDGRADIYSLGALTYEMLTGEPPFTGASIQAILAKVLNERPTPISTLRETVPPSVAQAVHTALAKLPADRFATAAEFATALRSERTSPVDIRTMTAPTALPPPPPPAMPAKRMAPFLGLAALNGVAVGALITALISWAIGHSRPRLVAAQARRYSIVLPDSAPLVAGHDMYGNSRRAFDLSRDGSQMVYVAAAGSSTRLMLLPLNGKPATPIAGTEGASGPAFSPDGHGIVYSVGGEIRRRSLDDGATVTLGRSPAIGDLSWVGDRILVSGWNNCLQAVAASGGELKPISNASDCIADGAAPIDDASDWLLASGQGALYGISKTTGKRQAVTMAGGGDAAGSSSQIAGTFPRFIAPRFVVFLRDSVLYAAPFDPKALHILEAPQPVIASVRREAAYGQGQFASSEDGTAVWASGSDGSIGNFVWTDRSGRIVERLSIPPTLVGSFVGSPDGKRIAVERVGASGRTTLFIADLTRHVVDSVALGRDASPMNWIRDGTALTVGVDSGSTHVAVLLFDGTHARIDFERPPFEDESRDGSKRCNASGNVWPAAQPADTVRFDRSAKWCRFSTSGKYVAWVTGDGLFAAPVDGHAGARVRLAPAGADEPIWTRDGREVLFRSGRRWFSVASPEVVGGAAPSPQQLFDGDFLQAAGVSWSLGPDGRFLLIEAPTAMRTTRIEVLTGLPRFLEEKFVRK